MKQNPQIYQEENSPSEFFSEQKQMLNPEAIVEH